MEDDYIWLSISLFCCKKEWNQLVLNGIEPFLNNKETTILLNNYTLELNYLSGENIRLSLLTAENKASLLAKHADEYFKRYFLNANLFLPETHLPVDGIFMPLPVNTIQYGLYPPRKIARSEIEKDAFSTGLSSIMITALSDDTIDEESIITFAFYLQTGLLKAITKTGVTVPETLKSEMNFDQQQIYNATIKLKFNDSKDILTEIADDVMMDIDNVPEWLKSWLLLCSSEIEKNRVVKIDEVRSFYRKIVAIINRHLAIQPQISLMLSYFIENTFLNRPE